MTYYGDNGYIPQNQQQRDAHQAALDAGRVFSEQEIRDRMRAQQDDRRRQEEAHALRDRAQWQVWQDARMRSYPTSVGQTSSTRSAQPSLTPAELQAQKVSRQAVEAERARIDAEARKQKAKSDARAREMSREIAARRRTRKAIGNTLGMLLILGFVPMFISVFGAGPNHSYVVGVLYAAILVGYFHFNEP